MRTPSLPAILVAVTLALPAAAAAQTATQSPLRSPDVIFVPRRPSGRGDAQVAKVGKGDIVYRPRFPDGRIPIAAGKTYFCARHARPHRHRIRSASGPTRHLQKAALATGSVFSIRICLRRSSEATVVTLYLLPSLNLKLLPKLKAELKPGDAIVRTRSTWDWVPEHRSTSTVARCLRTIPER